MFNRTRWIAAACLGLLTLLGGDCLSAAAPLTRPLGEAKAKMVAEGWQEISEGVFERRLGSDKVEHLGYGREGLTWIVGEMSQRLEFLRREQESYPSEKLAKIIDGLSMKVAKAKNDLWELERGASAGLPRIAEKVAGGSCSSICYSATADAYPLTSVQGVAAVAEAKFNSACGYSGETYAFAYARATSGTTTTTISQSDPDSGNNITSNASASVNGGSVSGIPCYSEASAYAQSSGLGISYSTSDTNNVCPLVACTATISGTGYEFFSDYSCRSRTWTANVSSGCTAFSYQWKDNGTVVSTGSTYTRNVCGYDPSFNLELTVNGTAYDSHYVTVDFYYHDPCNPFCN